MAIDYYGLFPCKVREKVPDGKLLQMEKARNRATTVLNLMRKNPGTNQNKPESEWTFKAMTLGPNGPQECEMRISDLLLESEPLQELSQHCANCPYNLRSSDFGCGGAIHYPVSLQAEKWLVSRLPGDLNTRSGQLLTQALKDFDFNGACIDAARERKDLYSSSTPATRKWGGFLSKKTLITSSQILHMAFAVGSLQPAHAKLVAYFLGFLSDDFQPIDLPSNRSQSGDDGPVQDLKLFLSVAALAGSSNIPVLIDA